MPVEPLPCAPGSGGEPGPSCCAPSIASTPLCLDDGSTILLVLRSACACDGAEPAAPEVVGWLDPATGQFTEGQAPDGAGPCRDECASVSLLRLCDETEDGCTPFLRHLVHDCTGTVTTSTDTTLDGTTPYTPAGTVIDCDDCPCGPQTKVVPLCDYAGPGPTPVTPFLRHLVYDCTTGDVLEQHDTLTDGATPYTATGEVADCGDCRPTPMCPQLLGLSGPELWQLPEGVESLAITVACGPVTITDCAGNATTVNECGAGFSWAAPTGDCAPGSLCTPFSVDVPEGSAVYLNLLAPCDLGAAP
ncbi:hypothetical protein ABZT26_02705 [Streptomyces sp. NPDC005395]|uniref:hypothetical protein n=1 Tax=unclassified Streptomyces TaxID=2593676 RepID=UPI001F34D537|nr:hypothetical protein [Streptomyces sp. BSE6.1]